MLKHVLVGREIPPGAWRLTRGFQPCDTETQGNARDLAACQGFPTAGGYWKHGSWGRKPEITAEFEVKIHHASMHVFFLAGQRGYILFSVQPFPLHLSLKIQTGECLIQSSAASCGYFLFLQALGSWVLLFLQSAS